MEENRIIESYVADAVHAALCCKSNKYPGGEYISEDFYRKIMREIQRSYVKIDSKGIPDYIKGKFIEIPDDLKKKYGGVVAILFLDE